MNFKFTRTIAGILVITFLTSDICSRSAWASPQVPAAPSVTRSNISDFILKPSELDFPLEHAAVREIHAGTNGKLIIHIQDAHANLGGQQNLATSLEHFLRRYDAGLVLVEGAANDVTFGKLKQMTASEDWKKAAKRFLFDGVISGEEYLNLATDHPMRIVGVEDRSLYDQNLKTYADLADGRKHIIDYLRKAHVSLERVKNRLYPKDLIALEAVGEEFSMARLDQLIRLAQTNSVSTQDMPEIGRLGLLREKEKTIDFERANFEQAALVRLLAGRGDAKQIESLLASRSNLKNNQASELAVWNRIFKMAEAYGIHPALFPELAKYRSYLGEFAGLRFDRLSVEAEDLEEKVYESLLRGNDDARKLRAIDRFLSLSEKAHSIRLSSREFAVFKATLPQIPDESWQAFLNRKLGDLGFYSDFIGQEPGLDAAASLLEFYEVVERRDAAFVQNAKRVMDERGQDAAFFIAGGYHTEHVLELLRDEGYSYVVLTPTVRDATDTARYEKLLLAPLRIAKDSGSARRAFAAKAVERKDALRGLSILEKNGETVLAAAYPNGDIPNIDRDQALFDAIAELNGELSAAAPGRPSGSRIQMWIKQLAENQNVGLRIDAAKELELDKEAAIKALITALSDGGALSKFETVRQSAHMALIHIGSGAIPILIDAAGAPEEIPLSKFAKSNNSKEEAKGLLVRITRIAAAIALDSKRPYRLLQDLDSRMESRRLGALRVFHELLTEIHANLDAGEISDPYEDPDFKKWSHSPMRYAVVDALTLENPEIVRISANILSQMPRAFYAYLPEIRKAQKRNLDGQTAAQIAAAIQAIEESQLPQITFRKWAGKQSVWAAASITGLIAGLITGYASDSILAAAGIFAASIATPLWMRMGIFFAGAGSDDFSNPPQTLSDFFDLKTKREYAACGLTLVFYVAFSWLAANAGLKLDRKFNPPRAAPFPVDLKVEKSKQSRGSRLAYVESEFKDEISRFDAFEKIIFERALAIKGLKIGFDMEETLTPKVSSVTAADLASEETLFRFLRPGAAPLLLGLLANNEISIVTAAGGGISQNWIKRIRVLNKLVADNAAALIAGEAVAAAAQKEFKIDISASEDSATIFDSGRWTVDGYFSINGMPLTVSEAESLINLGKRTPQPYYNVLKSPELLGLDILFDDRVILAPIMQRLGRDIGKIITVRPYALLDKNEYTRQIPLILDWLEHLETSVLLKKPGSGSRTAGHIGEVLKRLDGLLPAIKYQAGLRQSLNELLTLANQNALARQGWEAGPKWADFAGWNQDYKIKSVAKFGMISQRIAGYRIPKKWKEARSKAMEPLEQARKELAAVSHAISAAAHLTIAVGLWTKIDLPAAVEIKNISFAIWMTARKFDSGSMDAAAFAASLHSIARVLQAEMDIFQAKNPGGQGEAEAVFHSTMARLRNARNDLEAAHRILTAPAGSRVISEMKTWEFLQIAAGKHDDLSVIDLGSGTPPVFMERLMLKAKSVIGNAQALSYEYGRSRFFEIRPKKQVLKLLDRYEHPLDLSKYAGLYHKFNVVIVDAPMGDVQNYLREAHDLLIPGDGTVFLRFHRQNLGEGRRWLPSAAARYGWKTLEFDAIPSDYPASRDVDRSEPLFVLMPRTKADLPILGAQVLGSPAIGSRASGNAVNEEVVRLTKTLMTERRKFASVVAYVFKAKREGPLDEKALKRLFKAVEPELMRLAGTMSEIQKRIAVVQGDFETYWKLVKYATPDSGCCLLLTGLLLETARHRAGIWLKAEPVKRGSTNMHWFVSLDGIAIDVAANQFFKPSQPEIIVEPVKEYRARLNRQLNRVLSPEEIEKRIDREASLRPEFDEMHRQALRELDAKTHATPEASGSRAAFDVLVNSLPIAVKLTRQQRDQLLSLDPQASAFTHQVATILLSATVPVDEFIRIKDFLKGESTLQGSAQENIDRFVGFLKRGVADPAALADVSGLPQIFDTLQKQEDWRKNVVPELVRIVQQMRPNEAQAAVLGSFLRVINGRWAEAQGYVFSMQKIDGKNMAVFHKLEAPVQYLQFPGRKVPVYVTNLSEAIDGLMQWNPAIQAILICRTSLLKDHPNEPESWYLSAFTEEIRHALDSYLWMDRMTEIGKLPLNDQWGAMLKETLRAEGALAGFFRNPILGAWSQLRAEADKAKYMVFTVVMELSGQLAAAVLGDPGFIWRRRWNHFDPLAASAPEAGQVFGTEFMARTLGLLLLGIELRILASDDLQALGLPPTPAPRTMDELRLELIADALSHFTRYYEFAQSLSRKLEAKPVTDERMREAFRAIYERFYLPKIDQMPLDNPAHLKEVLKKALPDLMDAAARRAVAVIPQSTSAPAKEAAVVPERSNPKGTSAFGGALQTEFTMKVSWASMPEYQIDTVREVSNMAVFKIAKVTVGNSEPVKDALPKGIDSKRFLGLKSRLDAIDGDLKGLGGWRWMKRNKLQADFRQTFEQFLNEIRTGASGARAQWKTFIDQLNASGSAVLEAPDTTDAPGKEKKAKLNFRLIKQADSKESRLVVTQDDGTELAHVKFLEETSGGQTKFTVLESDLGLNTARDPLTLLLMGPPNAGKGTVASALKEIYPVEHLSTGDMLRHQREMHTALGLEAETYMKAGALVPDELVMRIIRDQLASLKETNPDRWYVFDGYPRTKSQLEMLERLLAEMKRPVDMALRLYADKQKVIDRAFNRRICLKDGESYNLVSKPPKVEGKCDLCGSDLVWRPDDQDVSAIRNRFGKYLQDTAVARDAYGNQGRLLTLPADQNPKKVLREAVLGIDFYLAKKQGGFAGLPDVLMKTLNGLGKAREGVQTVRIEAQPSLPQARLLGIWNVPDDEEPAFYHYGAPAAAGSRAVWSEQPKDFLKTTPDYVKVDGYYYATEDMAPRDMIAAGIPQKAIDEGHVIQGIGIFRDEVTENLRVGDGGNTALALHLLGKALKEPSQNGFVVYDFGIGSGVLARRAERDRRVKRVYAVDKDSAWIEFVTQRAMMRGISPDRYQIFESDIEDFIEQGIEKGLFENPWNARPVFIANLPYTELIPFYLRLRDVLNKPGYQDKYKPIVILAGSDFDWTEIQWQYRIPDGEVDFAASIMQREMKQGLERLVLSGNSYFDFEGTVFHSERDGRKITDMTVVVHAGSRVQSHAYHKSRAIMNLLKQNQLELMEDQRGSLMSALRQGTAHLEPLLLKVMGYAPEHLVRAFYRALNEKFDFSKPGIRWKPAPYYPIKEFYGNKLGLIEHLKQKSIGHVEPLVEAIQTKMQGLLYDARFSDDLWTIGMIHPHVDLVKVLVYPSYPSKDEVEAPVLLKFRAHQRRGFYRLVRTQIPEVPFVAGGVSVNDSRVLTVYDAITGESLGSFPNNEEIGMNFTLGMNGQGQLQITFTNKGPGGWRMIPVPLPQTITVEHPAHPAAFKQKGAAFAAGLLAHDLRLPLERLPMKDAAGKTRPTIEHLALAGWTGLASYQLAESTYARFAIEKQAAGAYLVRDEKGEMVMQITKDTLTAVKANASISSAEALMDDGFDFAGLQANEVVKRAILSLKQGLKALNDPKNFSRAPAYVVISLGLLTAAPENLEAYLEMLKSVQSFFENNPALGEVNLTYRGNLKDIAVLREKMHELSRKRNAVQSSGDNKEAARLESAALQLYRMISIAENPIKVRNTSKAQGLTRGVIADARTLDRDRTLMESLLQGNYAMTAVRTPAKEEILDLHSLVMVSLVTQRARRYSKEHQRWVVKDGALDPGSPTMNYLHHAYGPDLTRALAASLVVPHAAAASIWWRIQIAPVQIGARIQQFIQGARTLLQAA